jgi:hypothetical protein
VKKKSATIKTHVSTISKRDTVSQTCDRPYMRLRRLADDLGKGSLAPHTRNSHRSTGEYTFGTYIDKNHGKEGERSEEEVYAVCH